MKGIYIPQYDITLQFTNKSGSLVMLNSIIQFCKYNDIEYRFATNSDNRKVYVFTRNPIDRFITSYNWFMDSSENNANVKQIKVNHKIFTINDFISKYETIMYDIKDTHYQPQSFELLNYNETTFDINDIPNMINGYTFIKVEDVGDKINAFVNAYHYVHGEQSFVDYDYSELLVLNLIDEFSTLRYHTKVHFNLLYLSMKTILDSKHHKINNRIKLKTEDIVADIGKLPIFQLEIGLFGYNTTKSLI